MAQGSHSEAAATRSPKFQNLLAGKGSQLMNLEVNNKLLKQSFRTIQDSGPSGILSYSQLLCLTSIPQGKLDYNHPAVDRVWMIQRIHCLCFFQDHIPSASGRPYTAASAHVPHASAAWTLLGDGAWDLTSQALSRRAVRRGRE